MKKSEFTALECDILLSLQFDIKFVSPIPFLERFQRIFDFDREEANYGSWKVGSMARDFCYFMQREAKFLQFRPSQIAAASIVLAVKTYYQEQVAQNLMNF